jgi:uncharacterized protein YciI
MSLYVANDDQNAEDVQAAVSDDPMIKAGIGARYDVLPMLQLRMRA